MGGQATRQRKIEGGTETPAHNEATAQDSRPKPRASKTRRAAKADTPLEGQDGDKRGATQKNRGGPTQVSRESGATGEQKQRSATRTAFQGQGRRRHSQEAKPHRQDTRPEKPTSLVDKNTVRNASATERNTRSTRHRHIHNIRAIACKQK